MPISNIITNPKLKIQVKQAEKKVTKRKGTMSTTVTSSASASTSTFKKSSGKSSKGKTTEEKIAEEIQEDITKETTSEPLNPRKYYSVGYIDQSGEYQESGMTGQRIMDIQNKGNTIRNIKVRTKYGYFKTVYDAPSNKELIKIITSVYKKYPDYIPKDINIEIPDEIKTVGSEATNLYKEIVWKKTLDQDTSDLEKKLSDRLQKDYNFMSTQPVLGKYGDKTLSQIQKKQPAIYLEKNKEGKYVPEYDFTRWRREVHQERNKTLSGAIGEGATVITQSFLNIFNPFYWGAAVQGEGSEYLSRQHYGDIQKIKQGKWFDVWIGQQAPAYTYVIIPGLTAGVLGPSIAAGSTSLGATGTSIAASGGIGATAAGTAIAYSPYIIGGIGAGFIGGKILATSKFEEHGLVPKGTTFGEGLGTIMQVGSGYAGFKWGTSPGQQAWRSNLSSNMRNTFYNKVPFASSFKNKVADFKLNAFSNRAMSQNWRNYAMRYEGYKPLSSRFKMFSGNKVSRSPDYIQEAWAAQVGYRRASPLTKNFSSTRYDIKLHDPSKLPYRQQPGYTPTRLEIWQEQLSFSKYLKMKMPGSRDTTTYTKLIKNPAKPWEAKFVQSTNKDFIENIKIEQMNWKNFENFINQENLLKTSSIYPGEKATYTLGRVVSAKDTTTASGISYYKLNYGGTSKSISFYPGGKSKTIINTGDVFFQEKPFIYRGSSRYIKDIGDFSFYTQTGGTIQYGKTPISTLKINALNADDIFPSVSFSFQRSLSINPSFKKGNIIFTKYSDTKGELSEAFTIGKYSSKGKIHTFRDTAKIFKPEPVTKSIFTDTSGFDLGGIAEVSLKDTLFMPGGTGVSMEKTTFPQTLMKTSFPSNQVSMPRNMLSQLQFYEAGVVSSSYWSGIAPAMASSIPTLSFKTTNLSAQTNINSLIPSKGVKVQPLIGTKTTLGSLSDQKLDIATLNQQATSTLSKSALRQEQQSALALQQKQAVQSIQTQKQLQQLQLKLSSKYKMGYTMIPPQPPPITVTIFQPQNIRTPTIRTPPNEPPYTPIYQKIKLPDEKGRSKKTITDKDAYNVMVKDRMYVKGKKKYREKFIKINKKPLSYEDAMSYGSTVVDNSAARTFYIKPTGGKPHKPDIKISNWGFLQMKFNTKKDKQIEQNFAAIDTSGEIRDISARGWVAERRRMQPKKIKQKDILGDSFILDFKKNKNPLEKTLRRMGF